MADFKDFGKLEVAHGFSASVCRSHTFGGAYVVPFEDVSTLITIATRVPQDNPTDITQQPDENRTGAVRYPYDVYISCGPRGGLARTS